ncbi:hypothetical protein E2C01_042121 [Portunus trituberculatus]|uniref:Uncharacterized protein n=1 Tax=Portunus trituberculatus TaxID=210409 RepID=A0A5B7FLN6_PORTR|nr:hypothetical protein [Portunus trituberculatus]
MLSSSSESKGNVLLQELGGWRPSQWQEQSHTHHPVLSSLGLLQPSSQPPDTQQLQDDRDLPPGPYGAEIGQIIVVIELSYLLILNFRHGVDKLSRP